MRKGIGPFSIIVIGIIGSLVISGTYLFAFYGRSTVSKRAMIEVNVIDAINKIELKKISLSKALKYSFYQVSYILSKFGGYSDLSDQSIVKSYECIPYWREYPVLSYPGFSYIEETTAQFLSTYSKNMNDESSNPIYDSVAVRKNKFDQTEVSASDQDIIIDRDKIDVEVSTFLNQTLDDRIAKMYFDAERIFIINDGIKTAVEAAIAQIPPECKNINIGDRCENEIPTSEFVLNDKCPNWNQIVRETVLLQINEFNRYPRLSVSVENPEEDVFVSFKGKCSGNNIGESSSCGCKKSTSVDCGGYSSSGCDDYQRNNGCQNCYYPDGLYKGCFCGGCSSTKCSKCEEHYVKFEDMTCNYDYYISVNVLVEMTDNSDSEYLVYEDEISRFDKVKLDFRILSGNVYEDITEGVLANPSFEEGTYSGGTREKDVPNGWFLKTSYNPKDVESRVLENSILPKEEQKGESNALVLDEKNTYKIHGTWTEFSADLSQEISLPSGSNIVFIVPIQVHPNSEHGATINDALVRLSLNNEQREIRLRDHEWVYGSVQTEVPDDGKVNVNIHLESKSGVTITFFIDNLKLYKITADDVLEAKTNPCTKEIIETPVVTTTIPEEPGTCFQGNVEEKIREIEDRILNLLPNYPENLLKGIAIVESGLNHCNPDGTVKRGSSGEYGIMQIMPDTGSGVGCSEDDLKDWEKNIECGAEVLKSKYDAGYTDNYDPYECGYSYTDSWKKAVRGYNGWGCETTANKKYVCNVYEKAGISINPSECP